jgi:hypothetical protein
MAVKKLTINLGGIDRTLNFGKFWFQKFYGEAVGKDPLNGSEIELTPDKQFDFVVNLVYAGLKTTYKSEKRTEDFTKGDIIEWVGDEDNDTILAFIHDYVTLTTIIYPPTGEGKPLPVGG